MRSLSKPRFPYELTRKSRMHFIYKCDFYQQSIDHHEFQFYNPVRLMHENGVLNGIRKYLKEVKRNKIIKMFSLNLDHVL